MNHTKHLFEDGIYYLSNHSVACNGMFIDKAMQDIFIERMEFYLSPLCKILGYNLEDNSFEILIRLKDRDVFVQSFLDKQKSEFKDIAGIPESTYIFSQAMANLQVSFVKRFNHKYERSGTLMARRFFRKLMESENELSEMIRRLNECERYSYYEGIWVHEQPKSNFVINSRWMYDEQESEGWRASDIYVNIADINLGGLFESLPPLRLESSKNYFIRRFNLLFGPNP